MQIRIRHGALGSWQELRKSGRLVGKREMGEANLAQDLGDSQLVLWMRMTMEQRDSSGGNAFRQAIHGRGAHGGFIERFEHFSTDTDSLRHLADDLMEDGSRLVFERKKVAAALIADAQQIAETLRDEKRDASAFPDVST